MSKDCDSKLIQNVYGLVDASYQWHMFLKKGLIEEGFKQSQSDPCLFVEGQVIFFLYVNDVICMSPDPKAGDDLIRALKKRGYILTDEGSMSEFSELKINRIGVIVVEMLQPASIERIIMQVGLKDEWLHDTPADMVLHQDPDGQQRKNEFHDRSMIGQLDVLAATMHPEIQFAVHQCALLSGS